jgi:hypothetical protein
MNTTSDSVPVYVVARNEPAKHVTLGDRIYSARLIACPPVRYTAASAVFYGQDPVVQATNRPVAFA